MEKTNQKKRPEAVFLQSAAHFHELPEIDGEEYAILGRSNVGKSSFINHVLENRTLARISKTPGKTTLANFYKVRTGMTWVDLPGYGYAKASGAELSRWSKLIGEYCEKRENLSGLIWLVDIRHIGTKADIDAWNWFSNLDIPVFTVLTKADKLTASQRAVQVKKAQKQFLLGTEPVQYSVHDHLSRMRFWERFEAWRAGLGLG